MRPRPERLARLPEQYFGKIVGRAAAAAALPGEPVIDFGRGTPEVGPPAHVVERLAEAARHPNAHGYAPFLGLLSLREAIARRYRDVYGVELDPEREVAIVPGTKTAIIELVFCLAEAGETMLIPDPWYPDYLSGPALAGVLVETLPLDPGAGWAPDFDAAPAAALVYLCYPSNPVGVCAPEGVFAAAVGYAERTGAAIVHDFAYGDLVFDGRKPQSFLAEPGAKEVGVEMFSMSKSYGMAGWRVGFVVGNAEIVDRINLLNDHFRIGMFAPVQEASVAALTGPQDSVAERAAAYQRRGARVSAELGAPLSEATYYVWFRLPEAWSTERLLEETRVAIAPGAGFGPSGSGWARISTAVPDDVLETGLERLARALA